MANGILNKVLADRIQQLQSQQPVGGTFGQGLSSISSALAAQARQKQAQELALSNFLEQEKIKARFKDPYSGLINAAKVSQAIGVPLQQLMGGQQGGMQQTQPTIGTPTTGAIDLQPGQFKVGGTVPAAGETKGLRPQFRAETAEPSPLTGQLIPKTFKRVPSEEEKQAEIKGKVQLVKEKKRGEQQTSIEAGARTALNSLDLSSGAIRELAETYADAYREGGVGSKLKEKFSDASLFFGGRQAERFKETSALPGKTTEVVARLMPLLTQQGEKPGSVRLVQTIFDKLTLTLPKKNTPPKNAKSMMRATISNMYRFARAAARLGITNESIDKTPSEKLEDLSVKISNMAKTIQITGEERKQVDSLL